MKNECNPLPKINEEVSCQVARNEDIFYEVLDDIADSFDLTTWSEIFAEFDEVERAVAIIFKVKQAEEVPGFIEWREGLKS